VRCNTLYRASHIQTGLRVEIPDPDMAETNDVVPIGSLAGMAVLSLSTGNKLGRVSDVRIDPLAGGLTGLALEGDDNITLPYDRIYSFGRDAVMAVSDDSLIVSAGDSDLPDRRSKDLVGTTVVMESGEILGEIADILVTLKPPPAVVYEICSEKRSSFPLRSAMRFPMTRLGLWCRTVPWRSHHPIFRLFSIRP
jgi:sporulation protein YlmC with PRC-barrel domain